MGAIKKRTITLAVIAVLCLAFFFESAFAVKNTGILISITTAKKKIIKGNLPQAKKQAVSKALDFAVQKALVSLVPREVVASSLDFLYQKILSSASDYIITYRVLTGLDQGKYYLVAVESKVDLTKVEKLLTEAKIINSLRDKPSILFFISEKTGQDILPNYWWGNNPLPYESEAERIIIKQMIQDEFFISGTDFGHPDPSFYNIKFSSIYDTKAAMDLGREFKADMIVMGRVVASEAINRMGEAKTYNAVIDLEGFSLVTNEKVLVSTTQAVVKSDDESGNREAIIKAANLSVLDLSEKIDTFWTQNLRREHAFDVDIEGNEFLVRFIELKKRFRQMPEIENLQPKELGSDSALLELKYKGSPSQFANALMLKTFEDFGIELSNVSADTVSIKFIEKVVPVSQGQEKTFDNQTKGTKKIKIEE
jgi:hypothetical protein